MEQRRRRMDRCSVLRAVSVALVCAIGVLAPSTARAQGGASTASVAGKVTDATGGVLPGVTITVTNLATNQQRSIVTNDEGVYRFAGRPPGSYSIASDLEGFAKFLQSDITLQVGGASEVNV